MSYLKPKKLRLGLRLGIGVAFIGASLALAAPVAAETTIDAECKRSDLFEVETTKTGDYVRCQVAKGSSAHSKKPKFVWTKISKTEYNFNKTKSSKTIRMDGSSTVYPLMAVAAKYFQQMTSDKVQLSIGISGTGGGFEKFCKNETDMSNASRAISAKEIEACKAKGVTYTEIIVANDGLAVVVNPKSPVKCLTIDQLKKMWAPASGSTGPGTAKTWADVVGASGVGGTLGDLVLFGAGSDSGTFDSFNTFVHASSSKSRTDYNASENDNDTVKGVSAKTNAIGYYGLSYAIENSTKNRAIQIDKGAGCVTPTIKTVQDASYAMSRPLYVYVKNSAAASNPAIKKFMEFFFNNAQTISTDALFVPLTKAQIKTAAAAIKAIQ